MAHNRTGSLTRPLDSPGKSDADDFDPVAWAYDWMPVPTHPKRLAPRLRDVEGPVVDLGGGTGRFTVRMVDPRACRILIVDPAAKMLQKGRSKNRPIEPIQGVAEALPLADNSVAAVIATEAFHHFSDQQENVIQEAARVLRSDGLLLLEEPDPDRFIGRIMGRMERIQGMTSVFHPPDELTAMLDPHFASIQTARTGLFTYLAEARQPR